MMPPLQYRLAHSDVAVTDDDIKLLRDWARGDVVSNLGESEKTPADAGPGDTGRGKQVFASRGAGCHTLEQHREAPKLADVFGRTEWYGTWIHLLFRAEEGGGEMG
jgi:cytochrome c